MDNLLQHLSPRTLSDIMDISVGLGIYSGIIPLGVGSAVTAANSALLAGDAARRVSAVISGKSNDVLDALVLLNAPYYLRQLDYGYKLFCCLPIMATECFGPAPYAQAGCRQGNTPSR